MPPSIPHNPHQIRGAQWIAPRARGGLFDEMGMGKTATAILGLDYARAVRGIVICPASVRSGWCGEFEEWQFAPRRVMKGETRHDLIAWIRGLCDVLVISFELATKWTSRILEEGMLLDFVIIDEGHYLKTPEAARTLAILGDQLTGVGGLIGFSRHAWWLTGTPIPNDPADCFTFLRFAGVCPLDRPEFLKR